MSEDLKETKKMEETRTDDTTNETAQAKEEVISKEVEGETEVKSDASAKDDSEKEEKNLDTEGATETKAPEPVKAEPETEAKSGPEAQANKPEEVVQEIKILKIGEGVEGEEEDEVVMIDGTILKTDELTEPDIRNLEKRRDKLNSKAEEHKHKRDRLNDRTRQLIRQRESLANRIRKLVREAGECKENRNSLNVQVKEAKELREVLNRNANELSEKVNKLKRERIPKEDGPPMGKLRKELRDLEFKQQTSTLSASAERELVEKMKKLSDEIKGREKKLEQNEEVRSAIKEARQARQEAETQHQLVGKKADEAQERHDRMVSLYGQSDELRKDLNKIHDQLVDTKANADEEHRQHIALIRQVHDFDKLIFGMRRKIRRAKKSRGETDVKKHQKDIMDKFKKGEKLSTEDLLALQNK